MVAFVEHGAEEPARALSSPSSLSFAASDCPPPDFAKLIPSSVHATLGNLGAQDYSVNLGSQLGSEEPGRERTARMRP